MSLFPEMSMPTAAHRWPRRMWPLVTWRQAVQVLGALLQLPIRAPLRALDRDDLDDDTPVRRLVSAADAPKIGPPPLSSIFTIADAALAAATLRRYGRFGNAAGFRPSSRIERDGDRVRVVTMAPQQTEEWQLREQARRSKQKPPKPVKGARTRGKKVRQWDGEGFDG